jgi:transposase
MDNCSVDNVEDITEACEMFGGDFNFLSLYSPILNPVEECIADVKPAVQTEFATILRAPC